MDYSYNVFLNNTDTVNGAHKTLLIFQKAVKTCSSVMRGIFLLWTLMILFVSWGAAVLLCCLFYHGCYSNICIILQTWSHLNQNGI